MTEAEIEILRRNFPQLKWAPDAEPHRYRAHDFPMDRWKLAKFSDDSSAYAVLPVAAEFLEHDPARTEEFATEQLDRHLKRLLAGRGLSDD